LPINDVDEHVFKLVQVCKMRAKANPQVDELCKRACLTAIAKRVFFR